MLTALFLTFNVYAADPNAALIEQAQALAMKKQRAKAAQLLSDEIERQNGKSKKQLVDALERIARVFFTDKGQKLFESGQAMMFDNPDLSLGQLRESLNLEDGNLAVLDAVARVQLQKQDCVGASNSLAKARQLDSYAAEPAILELRALLCARDYEGFRAKLKSLPSLNKELELASLYMMAQDLIQQKLWRKAGENLKQVREAWPDFPEAYYWLAKVSSETGKDENPTAERYVSLCKNLTSRTRRKFSFEPRLCVNAKEVEDELAKKSNDDV